MGGGWEDYSHSICEEKVNFPSKRNQTTTRMSSGGSLVPDNHAVHQNAVQNVVEKCKGRHLALHIENENFK